MSSSEIPAHPGVIVLENPEVGKGIKISTDYSIEDLAHLHLATIRANADLKQPLVLYDYSMGALVLSVLATELRSQLPRATTFIFISAAMNTAENPLVTDERQAEWFSVKPGDQEAFASILRPFFSESFLKAHPNEFISYVKFRSIGANKQSPGAFIRQLAALRKFDGSKYFHRIEPEQSVFVYPREDQIVGAKCRMEVQKVIPRGRFSEISGGHMIFIEQDSDFLGSFFSKGWAERVHP